MHQQRRQKWIVYAKPPFGGPTQVLKYLARYTHRVAIDNSRIVAIGENDVVFQWKDRADHSRQRKLQIAGVEFLRRFLLHKLPVGFMRIRYYGFLANRVRRTTLPRIRELLHSDARDEQSRDAADSLSKHDAWPCPRCRQLSLRWIQDLDPILSWPRPPPLVPTARWEVA